MSAFGLGQLYDERQKLVVSGQNPILVIALLRSE